MPSAAERSENNFIRKRGLPRSHEQTQTQWSWSRCLGKQEPWRRRALGARAQACRKRLLHCSHPGRRASGAPGSQSSSSGGRHATQVCSLRGTGCSACVCVVVREGWGWGVCV